jgi:hypothetical protein
METFHKLYAAALKFNPNDKNAQFNYEFVKKKIEELEKQLSKTESAATGRK